MDTQLADKQNNYKTAVNEWIKAIRAEEDLAYTSPTLPQVDTWEQAHFQEDDARNTAKKAKGEYEAAIRQSLFQF